MGSRSRRYQRSLQCHCRFLRSYRRSLRPAVLSRSLRRSAAADAATPIVAQLAKHYKTLLNIVKHHETHVKHCETLKTLWNIMKQSSFDPTISALDAETSALDVETSAFGAATSRIARRSFDATISVIDAETSSLDAETSALGEATSATARSFRLYRRLQSWYNSADV